MRSNLKTNIALGQTFGHVFELIRKRSNNRRLMIWILLFNFGCFIFAYNGSEGTHRYLFTKLQYGWNEQQYTVFLTAYKVCYLIALWVLLPFCSRVLKLH